MNAGPEMFRTVHAIGIPQAPVSLGTVDQMGFKAHNLGRMAAAGLPVPQGFVLGTGWHADHARDPQGTRRALRDALAEWLRLLEQSCGLSFGGERRPLLLSVRSGAPVSMPGMMDTVLDIGLCDRTARGLLRLTGNPRLVWDSYRRLIQQFAETVHHADAAPFDALVAEALAAAGLEGRRELDFESLASLTAQSLDLFAELTGQAFPQDPREQLEAAVLAVLESWRSKRAVEYRRLHKLADALGTSVTVQRMVFGNAGGTSGSGVGFTRDPATGENRLYLDFLFNAQGEDVVSGRHSVTDTSRLPEALPEISQKLEETRRSLEAIFGDAQEFEFTVQDGRLYLLQARAAKRTPWASLQIAVDRVREGALEPGAALKSLEGIDLGGLARRRVKANGAVRLAEAQSASVGMATGVIALDAKACERLARKGKAVILVREETSTEDIGAIACAAGLLTVRGGRTSHAAVVARQMGKACVVGCSALRIDPKKRTVTIGAKTLKEGDTLCIDAESGQVFAGEPQGVVERPTELLAEVARWSSAPAG